MEPEVSQLSADVMVAFLWADIVCRDVESACVRAARIRHESELILRSLESRATIR
jgi:hypothetical protein